MFNPSFKRVILLRKCYLSDRERERQTLCNVTWHSDGDYVYHGRHNLYSINRKVNKTAWTCIQLMFWIALYTKSECFHLNFFSRSISANGPTFRQKGPCHDCLIIYYTNSNRKDLFLSQRLNAQWGLTSNLMQMWWMTLNQIKNFQTNPIHVERVTGYLYSQEAKRIQLSTFYLVNTLKYRRCFTTFINSSTFQIWHFYWSWICTVYENGIYSVLQ